MADGAVLGFVILHGDFEHIVTANAHAMDLWPSLLAWPGFRGVPGVLICLRLAHGWILTRLIAMGKEDSRLCGVAFSKKISNALDDFADPDGPIENGGDPAATASGVRRRGRKIDGFGARGD